MSITTKESDASPSLTQDGTATAQNAGVQASPRADAIGIEIPVVLYASRYSAAGRGLSKSPPPVREETRTVIVFSQGAVVRLSATVSVGEMVVLTNQQTGADVLCRVGAVKTQPGIQNYVDLEFTQRAPGFWEGRSAAGTTAPSERPASEPALRAVATSPAILAPTQQVSSPPSIASESASPIAAAKAVPEPGAAANPITPAAPETPRSSPARPVAPVVPHFPAASNAVSNVNTAPRFGQSGPSTLTGERPDWSGQTPSTSKKGLWAAIAAVFVAGVLAGGFLLNHRGQSASPETGVTAPASSAPAQPAAAGPTHEPQAPVAAESASSTVAVPAPAPTWLPDTPQHEQSQAGNVDQAGPGSRRSAVPVGKIAKPIAKTAATAGSSEPPPVLLTQDNAAAEGVLRSGVLSGASRVEAPAPPPAAGNSPAHAGGQLQMPRLISAPDPLYPATARMQNVDGIVSMDAFVDAAGNVTEVKVISGPILLRQAAMDALRKWKYQPARLDGQPTAVHTNVNIRFTLR